MIQILRPSRINTEDEPKQNFEMMLHAKTDKGY